MKGFAFAFVLALAVVCVSADDTIEEWKKMMEECKTEVGITEELPKGAKPNFEDSKVKCLASCLMKKNGMLKDGKIDANKVIEDFVQWASVTKNIFRECATEANKKTEECEVAGDFGKCVSNAVLPEEKE